MQPREVPRKNSVQNSRQILALIQSLSSMSSSNPVTLVTSDAQFCISKMLARAYQRYVSPAIWWKVADMSIGE